MPAHRRPLPPELGRTFALSEAYTAGVTPTRLRASDLDVPFRGVRTHAMPPLPADPAPGALDRAERARVLRLIAAYSRIMAPHAFLAGRTALVWHGVAVPHGPELEIGVHAPHRAPRRRGITGRKIAPHLAHCQSEAGLLVATPATA